ncbi:Exocyst complex component 5 [Armadillidium nasatum]|uniref:Exocyst complex component 5 n=1 Tax=Armadillidium nasatum TaxID=96803 RepID=A0A5N5T9H3_9CRUS|nr:Exocyst complex component 5 [Armadillidium nasatum]
MLNHYLQELEQDPFDGEEFVERLAWRVHTNSAPYGGAPTAFDPDLLHSAFTDAIKRIHSFQELDSHINSVATKVVHLGDQLENVNTPRSRAVEAQRLMNHFAEFLSDGPLVSEVFTDKSRIYEAADVIQKLYLIAQELPTGKFETAKKKITDKYYMIENALIHEFKRAHMSGDRDRMKEIASTLSHFKGYNQCVNAFIEEAQIDHIQAKLEHKNSPDLYLSNLYDLYSKTNRLCTELQGLNLGSDSQFLPRLTKQIFQQHLSSYISIETRYLKEKLKIILTRYYESKGHQKKIIHSGGINEIREKIQDVISSKANINIGSGVENYGGETFLSEEVAISLLQETKHAFKRCQMLSTQSEVHNNAVEIFDLLTKSLLVDHVDYAIELGLQTIPGGEVRTPPELSFFQVVQQSSSMINLLDKLFNDSLVPLIISTPKHGESLQRKKQLMQTLERKLDMGIDKALTAICNYACQRVVRWVSQTADKLKDSLDGNNLESVLLELGLRLHRVIQEHLLKFEYNNNGAMAVICDVNEYRKCVASFKQPLVNTLFDTLHTLCKLLQVPPENLKLVCSGDQLSGLDRTVLANFIQLRSDYKTNKLGHHFK